MICGNVEDEKWEKVGKSGRIGFNFTGNYLTHLMPQFIGEFECKVDSKGRVVLPSGLKRQIPEDAAGRMVVNRGFDKCLVLYTRQDWDAEVKLLDGLSQFNRMDRKFIRLFNNGATEVQIDNASRILLPKKLSAYAEIDSDVVFYAYGNRIEIWSQKNYDEQMAIDPDEFSDLAEKVMGGGKQQNNQPEDER